MSTVVFFSLPAHSHTNPTLPLVAELVRQGEKVIYYSHEDFQSAIEQTGATFRRYGTAYPFDHTYLDENICKLVNQMMLITEFVLDQLLEEVKALQPAYIIHDSMCVWGNYMAQILRVPAVVSIVIFALNIPLILSVPWRFMELMQMTVVSWKDVVQTFSIAGKISKKYKVKRFIDYGDLLQKTGQIKILYTCSLFQPFADRFDSTYKFMGYHILPRTLVPSFPFETLSNKPLIYISLGTIYNEQADFYHKCFEAFADSKWQVVMSVGSKVFIDQPGNVPENFIVKNTVPQLDILQRTSLFISAGGPGSVKEALVYGVPLLVIPQAADHAWVANRVAQLKAGKVLRKEKVTATCLRQYAEEIIATPGYAQNSIKVGQSLQSGGGYPWIVKEIQQMKEMYAIK